MGWIYLLLAGLCEIGFTTFLNLSNNFTRLLPTLAFLALAALSFAFLSFSLKSIPLGTAYAIWTGIGAFGTAIIGVAFFNESADFWRILFLALLIGSIVGLKVVSPH
ncbi:MAG: multidrug efflux SMR transporter [Chlamydiales bacterium]|nr:multidrug efflux SMR transporter [Chlamydiales bacterium]